MDLDEALNEWLKQVTEVARLSPSDQAKITKAGAQVFKSELESETRAKHYSSHNDKVYGHMADSVIMKNTNGDGEKDGTSSVGFDTYHDANARRLNNGTKKYSGDHFITNLRANAMDKVLKAESEEYQKLINKGDK